MTVLIKSYYIACKFIASLCLRNKSLLDKVCRVNQADGVQQVHNPNLRAWIFPVGIEWVK